MTSLLLDAHLSGRAIGRALRDRGHNIRALDAEKDLEGLRDEDVLELAISENRVLITANVADFLPLLTTLIESGRSHPGCILIPKSFRNEDFGPSSPQLTASSRKSRPTNGPTASPGPREAERGRQECGPVHQSYTNPASFRVVPGCCWCAYSAYLKDFETTGNPSKPADSFS